MEKVRLGDICELKQGYAFKSKDYVEKSKTINCRMSNIRPGAIFDVKYNIKYLPDEFASKYREYILKDDDIIIAMTDLAGDPKILGVPAKVKTDGYNLLQNQRVGKIIIKSDKQIDFDYLKYVLSNPKNKDYYQKFAGGGLQINISPKDILNIKISVYPIGEQKLIARKFNKVQEIINLRKKQIEELDEFIKTQFVQMFGNPFDNSKWKIKKLGEVAESIYDGTNIPPKYYQKEEKVLFLRIQNVWKNEFRLEDSVYVSEEINKKYIDTSLKKGDLLITKIGRYYTKESSLGRVAIYLGENNKANYSNNIMRIRVKNEINSEFLNILLNLDDYQKYIKRVSKGGTDKRALSKSVIEKFPIINPPIELQKQFIEIVRQINKQKVIMKKSLKEIKELQESLMNRYFG